MEENWYAVEQQIRDRISEARAAARIRTLTQKPAPTGSRPDSAGISIIRLANWVLARAVQLKEKAMKGVAPRKGPAGRLDAENMNARPRQRRAIR